MKRPKPIAKPPAKPSGSQSLERGLDVLELIEAQEGEIGVREIARRLKLGPPIVQRLVSSLAARGYIEKNAETARYRLSYRSLALGANGGQAGDYIAAARRELERLAREHRLNGFVMVLRGDRAVYLLAVQADGPIGIKVRPGSEMPLHSTAGGKVLLASVSDDKARGLLGGNPLAAITPQTITDPESLIASLPAIRRQGYATVAEENIPGVLSVGAPIRDRGGRVVAALSVAFPKFLDAALTVEKVAPLVVDAAARTSKSLGGR
jgi:DNA-binding IclR family transcriptional regulator